VLNHDFNAVGVLTLREHPWRTTQGGLFWCSDGLQFEEENKAEEAAPFEGPHHGLAHYGMRK